MRTLSISLLLLTLAPLAARAQAAGERGGAGAGEAPIYVVLWFDTEDYILPRSDDAAKQLAELLTRLGVRATFKVVGEKARVLEERRRHDVIGALRRHEIGYHSDTHSQQPTIAVYMQNLGWEDGAAEFERREGRGVRDIKRIFGVTPTCYGQPGSSWVPQAYPALERLGIGMYLDEGNHVGVGDQPFFYCGMLNVFKMRANVARMELGGEGNLSRGKEKFAEAYDRLRAQGGGTISIYYHPAEFVHREFWDAVNFARGQNPTRGRWRAPATKAEAEIRKAFDDFEQYVTFIKARPGVRFVTASELAGIYADRATKTSFRPPEVLALARSVAGGITFQRVGDATLSGAEIFLLLNEAVAAYVQRGEAGGPLRLTGRLYGLARRFTPAINRPRPARLPWEAFAAAVLDVQAFCRERGRIPDEVWIGVDNLSPQDYLATLAGALIDLSAGGARPAEVTVRQGRLSAEEYVAEDSPRLWGWLIFPEGFHAPNVMELARLQAWTLKPAVIRR